MVQNRIQGKQERHNIELPDGSTEGGDERRGQLIKLSDSHPGAILPRRDIGQNL